MNKAEQLVKLLIEKKYTVSFAESCTGGKMAARIAYDINQNTSSKAIAAMSDDNQETINEYKDKLFGQLHYSCFWKMLYSESYQSRTR